MPRCVNKDHSSPIQRPTRATDSPIYKAIDDAIFPSLAQGSFLARNPVGTQAPKLLDSSEEMQDVANTMAPPGDTEILGRRSCAMGLSTNLGALDLEQTTSSSRTYPPPEGASFKTRRSGSAMMVWRGSDGSVTASNSCSYVSSTHCQAEPIPLKSSLRTYLRRGADNVRSYTSDAPGPATMGQGATPGSLGSMKGAAINSVQDDEPSPDPVSASSPPQLKAQGTEEISVPREDI